MEPDITFDNLSTGAVSYFWTFGDGGSSNAFEPTHTYTDTGTYTVMLVVVNVYGCIDTVYKLVHIKPVFHMFIPNAFTPNQDGVNDHFYVVGEGIIATNICIFNRWGERIYQTNNNTKGWDGTIKDGARDAQQDVYVYDILVTDVFGKKHHEYGRVNLVR
jgi:gliding motility-associated-like protein